MKKALAIGLLLASSSAFGSTARMAALQSPIHVKDVVTTYTRPSDMMAIPEMITFDLGLQDTTAPFTPAVGDDARGGMIKAIGGGRLGFFLGVVDDIRDANTPTNPNDDDFLGIENPFSIAYGNKMGDMSWAVFFTMANSDKKSDPTVDKKASYMNLTGSVEMGDLIAGADLGLGDKADGSNAATDTYKNAPMGFFGQYAMGSWTVHGRMDMNTMTVNTGTEQKTETTTMTLGALNSMKKDGVDFFYGASYKSTTVKDSNTTTQLPVLIGIEADAASWLTLRGSVTQNVFLGSDKDQGAEADSIPHNTTIAAGAGFKFNQAVLDVTLNAQDTGNLDSDLGAQAGLTYMF